MSAAESVRRATSFSSARSTIEAGTSGMSDRTSRMRGTGCVLIASIIACADLPANGSRPVSISNRVNRSDEGRTRSQGHADPAPGHTAVRRPHCRPSRSRRFAPPLRPHRGVAVARRRSQRQPAAHPSVERVCVAVNYCRCLRSREHRRAHGEDSHAGCGLRNGVPCPYIDFSIGTGRASNRLHCLRIDFSIGTRRRTRVAVACQATSTTGAGTGRTGLPWTAKRRSMRRDLPSGCRRVRGTPSGCRPAARPPGC